MNQDLSSWLVLFRGREYLECTLPLSVCYSFLDYATHYYSPYFIISYMFLIPHEPYFLNDKIYITSPFRKDYSTVSLSMDFRYFIRYTCE